MSGEKRLPIGSEQPAISVNSLPERLRQITAVICVLLFIQVIYLPLQARPAGRQLQSLKKFTQLSARTASATRDFSLSNGGEAKFDLTISAPGRIQVTAAWTGTASSLALMLNGPGQTQYYARRDGSSPLSLDFEMTQELLNKGSGWKLSLVSFQSGVTAQGKIDFKLPPGSSVNQLSGEASTSAQNKTAAVSTSTQAQPKAVAGTAAPGKTEAVSTDKIKPSLKPKLKDLFASAKKEEVSAVEIQEDVSELRKSLQDQIQKITQTSNLGGIVVPLFFKYLEETADNQRLVREFYRSSEHRRAQTEEEFARGLKRAVKAYREIPSDFKARYLNPRYADLKKGDRVELKQLGNEVVRLVNPGLESQVKQIVRESFSGKYQLTQEQVLALQNRGSNISLRSTAAQTRQAKAQVQLNRQALASASSLMARMPVSPSQTELNELRSALQQAGVEISDKLTSGSLVHQVLGLASPGNALAQIEGRTYVTDYYRYKLTLDWFNCLDKNERSDDEPYFGIIATLPQFDPNDTAYFKFLKDGCLNRTGAYVTRTYGGVEKNGSYGLKGNDRIMFDYPIFNSSASFTIQLWEEDYSKGSVADGLRNAAMSIMKNIQSDLKAAVISQIQSYIAEAILSAGGVSSSGALQILDQIFTGNLSFANFQSMLFNLYSGRAFDVSWYLIYFLFSGGDFIQTLAMIGGGSTVAGAVILGLAIVGPAFSDMIKGFYSGDVEKGLVNLFKIITVIPLLVDFFEKIITSLIDIFRFLMAIVDPDDYLGEATVVIEQTSANWHNDAREGAWQSGRLMGGVPVNQADSSFAQKGYGPTRDNSSFVENNIFWVPGFTIKGGDAEYNVYYEVKREVAGGRTTLGFYFPSNPAYNLKKLTYRSKSSPEAWWTNILRFTVMSVNTEETPLLFVTDRRTGKTYLGAELGNPFEIEAIPGAEYDLWLVKLSEGEMAGYVSIYEGPKVNIECAPRAQAGAPGAPPRPGTKTQLR